MALWYNLVLCYSQLIPVLGPTLSRLREYSCDLGGFWVGISQLPRSYPWTVRRTWRLHQLSLFSRADTAGKAPRRPLDVGYPRPVPDSRFIAASGPVGR